MGNRRIRITYSLPPEQVAWLERTAEDATTNVSHVVRCLVQQLEAQIKAGWDPGTLRVGARVPGAVSRSLTLDAKHVQVIDSLAGFNRSAVVRAMIDHFAKLPAPPSLVRPGV